MLIVICFCVPIALVLCNIVCFKADFTRVAKFTRVFSIIFGGILYAVLTKLMKSDNRYSDNLGLLLALDIFFLFAVLIAVFVLEDEFSIDMAKILIGVIVALNVYPALYLLVTDSVSLYGVLIFCPLLYHFNLMLVSGSAIYKIKKNSVNGATNASLS